MRENNSLSELTKVFNDIGKAAVFCHSRPDGDALGSGLALCAALRNAGKEAHMVCEDVPPQRLSFLPYIKSVSSRLPCDEKDYDTFIAVDCADPARIGSEYGRLLADPKTMTVNIDHHISNTGFAKYNYVVDCPATCELMPEIFDDAGFAITRPIADLLMAGLMTDSGNFAHQDVTDKTFSVAARLKKAGADSSGENYMLFTRQTKPRALLYARVLSSLRFYADDRIAVIYTSLEDLEDCGADSSLTEGFVDFPLSIDGMEVAISILQVKGGSSGQYKVSFRSRGRVDVNAIASTFGGGGHVMASGCMLFGKYEDVERRLIETTTASL